MFFSHRYEAESNGAFILSVAGGDLSAQFSYVHDKFGQLG
jgi:hypothetical protein